MTRLITLIIFVSVLLGGKKKEQPPFNSLIFHTTRCFGACPVFHLKLENNGKMKLYAESVFKTNRKVVSKGGMIDSAKTGYFEGYADYKSFRTISKIINDIGLDTIKYKAAFCCDAPVKTIIMYQNNKRVYIKSMFLPEKISSLVDALYEICKTSKLTRSLKKFEIESDSSITKRNTHSLIEINNQTNH